MFGITGKRNSKLSNDPKMHVESRDSVFYIPFFPNKEKTNITFYSQIEINLCFFLNFLSRFT